MQTHKHCERCEDRSMAQKQNVKAGARGHETCRSWCPPALAVARDAAHRVNTSPYAHTRTFSRCARLRTPDVSTRLAKGLAIRLCASKVISSLVMSLLNVPSTTFPPTYSSPTASPTPLTGIRLNPCATPLWSGPSGHHLADPTRNTGYEPKFCIIVSSEHTPINLPTRNMSFQQEYDATIAASEDLNLPRLSGASSSSQRTAASRVLTLCLTKVSADFDSVASRTSISETCADMDRETVGSSLFGSVS